MTRLKGNGVVYFVQVGADGPIKIGVTGALPARMKALQSRSDEPLTLLSTRRGAFRDEARIHARLEEHALGGEWFSPHPEVFAVMKEENEPPMNLGERIASAREDADLSREALASAIHVSFSTIMRMEAGTKAVSVSELHTISTLTGKPIDYFLAGVGV